MNESRAQCALRCSTSGSQGRGVPGLFVTILRAVVVGVGCRNSGRDKRPELLVDLTLNSLIPGVSGISRSNCRASPEGEMSSITRRHAFRFVEPRGIEPLTPALQRRCSTN